MKELLHSADFCVIGGGLSGVCAAVAAARHGVKVVLMQDRPMLGGNASSEIRMWVCGANDRDHDYREAGILEEIELENYYRNPTLCYQIWDTVIYEKVMLEENITLLLNCTCQSCEMDGNVIKSVRGWQMTSETYHTVEAKYFADCSGDSILAPLTGASFRAGREARDEFGESIAPEKADKCTMGLSCMFQIRETDRKQTFVPPEWAYSFPRDEDMPDREHNIGTNYWWIEIGGDRDSIHDTDELRHELLKISYGVWDHCKNHGHPEYDNWVMDWIGFLPGKRESRRYVGDYILTENDVLSGGHFDDIVAYGGWTMDDHFPAGFYYRGGYPTIHHYAPVPWGIPWRALYSENIDNLLFAGRNISATHTAMSSSRVMGTCSIVGQAVGTGVSVILKDGKKPREADVNEIQQTLMYDDCLVPFVDRRLTDLTLKARTNAEITRNGVDRAFGETQNCWIGKKGEYIEYSFDSPEYVRELRIVFDSNFHRPYHNMPSNYPLNEKKYKLPDTIVKSYSVEITDSSGNRSVIRVDNNRRRLATHRIESDVLSVRIIPSETWGNGQLRVFSVDLK